MTSSTSPSSTEVRPGSLADALRNGRALLNDHPDLALSQAHAILRRDSRNSDALRLAAAAHRKRGELDRAEAAEMTAIQYSQSIPALKAAAEALGAGEAGEASRIAAEHLGQHPDELSAVTLSAESALALGLPHRAEPLLRHVLDRAPNFAPAERLLISALIGQDKLQESRARLEALAEKNRAGVADLALLARVQADSRDFEAAAATCERMLQHDDSGVETWIQYGDTLRFLGRRMDSALAYRRALAVDPHSGLAWWSLVGLGTDNIDEDDIAAMHAAIEERADRPKDLGNLHFALGSIFDTRAEHESAFRNFQAGNEIVKAAQPYDPEELTARVNRSIERLTAAVLAPREPRTAAPATPVFIIGMPRSGSTLVERVLGCHSAIEAMGELPIVPHLIQRLKAESPKSNIAEQIASLTTGQLGEMAEHYRQRAGELRKTDSPYFTDKLHMNWQHLPLVLRMFPTAKIVDVRRNALDCCWSNYKVLFARGHPAATDQYAIGRFYRDYIRLMTHIQSVAPDRVTTVDYEEFITDLEAQTRRLLDHIGLEFEAKCLEFHRSKAPVATASSEQVRRPLNREGIGAWKPYEQWLGPLFEVLGPLARGAPEQG